MELRINQAAGFPIGHMRNGIENRLQLCTYSSRSVPHTDTPVLTHSLSTRQYRALTGDRQIEVQEIAV
jgi:hypothetical protein